jgi:hypothetical protein
LRAAGVIRLRPRLRRDKATPAAAETSRYVFNASRLFVLRNNPLNLIFQNLDNVFRVDANGIKDLANALRPLARHSATAARQRVPPFDRVRESAAHLRLRMIRSLEMMQKHARNP